MSRLHQRQHDHHQHQHEHSGVGVVTESVAFKLVCDMQHLRGKVDLVCGLGAALAQRWVEEVVQHSHLHQLRRAAVLESRLRSELEELVLELVDVSVEIQKMKERKEQVLRFFYLTERRSSWCQVYDGDGDSDSDSADDESVDNNNKDMKMKMNVETKSTNTTTTTTNKGEAKAMLKMIDLDECDQVIDRLTTLLLGYLTAGEREEEERALRSRTHSSFPSDVDIASRLPRAAASSTTSIMRLPNDQHDDSLLR
jgi:hypothetical protein